MRRLMSNEAAGRTDIRSGYQGLTAKRATLGMRSIGQPCIRLHTSFLFARKVRHHARPGARRGPEARHAEERNGTPVLILRLNRPYLTQINGLTHFFRRGTSDNADKSAVPRKNFHSTGVFLKEAAIPRRPARTLAPMRVCARDTSVDWHDYCIQISDRGEQPESFAGYQVGIRLSPRLHI